MTRAIIMAGLLAGLILANPSGASDKKANREREMLRRVQVQLQQAQSQVGGLEQEKAKLAQDLAAAEKGAKAASAARAQASRLKADLAREQEQREVQAKELETARQDIAALRERLAQTEKQLAESSQKLQETTQTLARSEAERQTLEAIQARQTREIALAEEKNLALYQLGRDLMVRYENKSCGEILVQKEPFTGLKRVQIENLLEEYRDKLDEQRILKPPGG